MTKQTKELFQMTLEHSILMAWEIDGETVETVSDFIFGSFKITADGYCSCGDVFVMNKQRALNILD